MWTPQGDLVIDTMTPPPTPFAWGGRWGGYTDADTGFVQLGARFYSPATGQFMARDPSGFGAGPNLYASAPVPACVSEREPDVHLRRGGAAP